MSYDKVESTIRALLLLNLLKVITCSATLAFYRFSLTRLINLIKPEQSCKLLYLSNFVFFIL